MSDSIRSDHALVTKLPEVLMARFLFLPLIIVAAAGAAPHPESHGGGKFEAKLSGAAEVPGPGDPDGAGSAVLTVNPGKHQICYTITAENIGTASMAHIHSGTAGTAPPNNVVVSLTAPAAGKSEGCSDVTHEAAMAIMKDPAAYYVNVHNAEFPAGALRGQLTK